MIPGPLPGADRRKGGVPALIVTASDWAWRLMVLILFVGLAVYAAAYVGFIVGPIVVAAVICALLEPIRRFMLSRGSSPTAAWSVAFLFGVVFVTAVILLAVSQFSSNFDMLSRQTTKGVNRFTRWLSTGPLHMKAGGVDDALDRAVASIKRNPTDAVTGTVSVLSTTGALLGAGLLTFITTLFFMKDRAVMWLWFTKLFPQVAQPRVDSAGRAAWEVLVSYTKVTLASAVFDSVVIGVVAAGAGLPVSFALGVIVFLFAFIPIIGAIFSGIVVVLVALVSQGTTTALVMAAVVLAVQQVDANILYPLMANRQLSLHPLASLLLVAAGGIVAGLFGAFIAVPLAAVLMAVTSDLRNTAPRLVLPEDVDTG
jgi:predicted PurR-regulated permease PerM